MTRRSKMVIVSAGALSLVGWGLLLAYHLGWLVSFAIVPFALALAFLGQVTTLVVAAARSDK